MSFSGLLNKTVTIKTKNQTRNDLGGVNFSFVDLHTNVKARIQPIKNPSVSFGDYQLTVNSYYIYIAGSQAGVVPENVIIDSDNNHYEIIHAVKDSSGHHWEVLAELKHFK